MTRQQQQQQHSGNNSTRQANMCYMVYVCCCFFSLLFIFFRFAFIASENTEHTYGSVCVMWLEMCMGRLYSLIRSFVGSLVLFVSTLFSSPPFASLLLLFLYVETKTEDEKHTHAHHGESNEPHNKNRYEPEWIRVICCVWCYKYFFNVLHFCFTFGTQTHKRERAHSLTDAHNGEKRDLALCNVSIYTWRICVYVSACECAILRLFDSMEIHLLIAVAVVVVFFRLFTGKNFYFSFVDMRLCVCVCACASFQIWNE